MKILKNKECGYLSFSEKFDLCDAFAGKKDIPIGVVILYILLKHIDVSNAELSAEADGEIGEERNIISFPNVSNEKFLDDLYLLSDIFLQKELKLWELKCNYADNEVAITGRTYGTVISVRYPLKSKISFISLMIEIENETYFYHEFDQDVLNKIKDKFKINQKLVVKNVIELNKYQDIWNEFLQGINDDPFSFPFSNAVEVERYTAETLFNNYPLSELGAYNYLLYLRNDPENAIKDLKNGLPRK